MVTPDPITVLKRQQGSLKAKITNLKRFLDDNPAPEVPRELEDLEVNAALLDDLRVSATYLSKWLQVNQNLMQEYEDFHSQLIAIVPDEALARRYEELISFESSYYKTTSDATVRLRHLNSLIDKIIALQTTSLSRTLTPSPNNDAGPSTQHVNENPSPPNANEPGTSNDNNRVNPNGNDNASDRTNMSPLTIAPSPSILSGESSSNNTGSISAALPVLSLQTFHGQSERFNTYYASFKSLIHNSNNLSIMTKFLYLKNSLGPEPLRVIEHLDLLEGNYETALNLLEKRYRDTRLMVHTHLKGIIECPGICKGSSSGSLRVISDSIQGHLRALETLGEPVQSWASLVKYLVIDKLDFSGRREWEAVSISKERPTLTDLFDFLEKRCHLQEKIEKTSDKTKNTRDNAPNQNQTRFKPKGPNNINQARTFVARSQASCAVCKGSHFIYNCNIFLNKTIPARLSEVRRLGLCENCLRYGHKQVECNSQHCKKCTKFHATLLHPVDDAVQTVTAVSLGVNSNPLQILPTAEVFIFDSQGQAHKCVALLDCASQSSFITKSLQQRLKLPSKTHVNPLQINGIESIKSSSVKDLYCDALIRSVHTEFTANASFVILNSITNRLSAVYADPKSLSFPRNIKLANPNYQSSCQIYILLGVGLLWPIIKVPDSQSIAHPLLQNTQLGYVISSELNSGELHTSPSISSFCALSISDISRQLHRFWEIESLEIKAKVLSPEEIQCEQSFVTTTSRNEKGLFIVQMPLGGAPTDLGDFRSRALTQFKSLERRLNSNKKLKVAYTDFMREYEDLGHMTKVSADKSHEHSTYYLPHHPVFKDDSLTTKLRVVFNSSAPSSNGVSLNYLQLNGPLLQSELFSILLRFRRYRYILSADCTKMYRCVVMHLLHRPLQRILWRSDISQPIETYQLNTVTYGQKSSSFLAIRCLFELATQCEQQHP